MYSNEDITITPVTPIGGYTFSKPDAPDLEELRREQAYINAAKEEAEKTIIKQIPDIQEAYNAWDIIWLYIKYPKLVPYTLTILAGYTMKDWKTTITGLVGALAYLLGALHIVELSPEVQNSIIVLTVALIGWFATDAKKEPVEPADPAGK